jgi:glyoxylase-like metal-dependent hydrolase (beta-lactamase superfamily II)
MDPYAADPTTKRNATMTETSQQLKWDVFVSPGIPTISSSLPPGEKQTMWSPISSTLIYGKRDSILVDTPFTIEQTNALVDWLAASGKNLTTIYITHDHGDHWFGVGALLDRFPKARAVATPNVIRVMRQQASPESISGFWSARFPGQIPDRLVIAEELKEDTFDLEGQELATVDVGHSDTDNTTCLHVPSAGLVVAGDVAYNDVHLMLAESRDSQKRMEWISALDKIESLKPRAVIAGHKRAGREDSPKIIEETRQYIRDFDRTAETTNNATELYNKMLGIYPNRLNRTTVWFSARAIKG